MVCKTNCATITGISVLPVVVETDIANGLPSFDMVGLLSSDVKEARERVRTALKNSGFMLPTGRITINIAPGHIRKSGTYFDVAIAISILQSMGVIEKNLDEMMFIGELSLNGEVIAVNGVLPMVLDAASRGIEKCFVPRDNANECINITSIEVIPIKSLNELVMMLSSGKYNKLKNSNKEQKTTIKYKYDFKEIKGQTQARKGAEIAAAGQHNLIMIGSPGTGKSAIAKATQSILPDMTEEERIEISKIQSIAGNLKDGPVTFRPFRSPHNTATVAAMTGGGINPRPGEITLAHGGVLFMDEFPEFSRGVMETLRQPLEDGIIKVSRIGGDFEFPARFILLAAMNPCRCGYYPDRNRCNCTERDVQKYTEKVSGPIMDRMDLCVHMNPVKYTELEMEEGVEDSETIRTRVNQAVKIQRERYVNENIFFNSQLEGEMLNKYCHLASKEKALMENIYETFKLSVRSYQKILKVARTIADLSGEENIKERHLAEALSFKVNDGKSS